jgi:hypothetical protein
MKRARKELRCRKTEKRGIKIAEGEEMKKNLRKQI